MDKLQYKKQWIEEQIADNRASYLEAQETRTVVFSIFVVIIVFA